MRTCYKHGLQSEEFYKFEFDGNEAKCEAWMKSLYSHAKRGEKKIRT